MFFFHSVDFLLQLINVSFMQAQHLLHLQIECLDFPVFGSEVALESAFFCHDLLHVQVAGLQQLVVRNVSEGGLGGVSFDLFLPLRHHVLQLFLNAIVRNSKLSQSELIFLSQFQPILNFVSQFFPGFLEVGPQGIDFKSVISIAILHLASETIEVSLIKLRNLDFSELNFPLVVLNDVLDLVLQLVVVLLDLLEPSLLVLLQVSVELQQSLDFLLLGSYHCLQNGDVRFIVASQVGLSLSVRLALLRELRIIVGSKIFDASSVAVVVVLELVTQRSIIIDQAGNLCLSLLASAFEAVRCIFNLMLFLLYLVSEPFDLRLMQVSQLILVLLVLPDQVVSHIFVFRLHEVELMSLLLVQLLELISTVICLNGAIFTSAFISSLLRRSWRAKFSISKLFSSMVSFNFLIFSSCISELPF